MPVQKLQLVHGSQLEALDNAVQTWMEDIGLRMGDEDIERSVVEARSVVRTASWDTQGG